MLLGHILLGLRFESASLPQPVVQSTGEAAPFLDGQLHLHTPPDMHDVVRLVAAGLDNLPTLSASA